MISLGGVYVPRGDRKGKLPAALAEYLDRNSGISVIALHLDNDYAGRSASDMLMRKLQDLYLIRDEPPLIGKDMNDELLRYAGQIPNERKG